MALGVESGQATGLPFALIALLVAIAVGVALFWSQRWLARRTHRVANAGLLLASVAGIMSVLWLAVALTVARVELGSARTHGSAPVQALAQADIAALRAHADESLEDLIDDSGDDSFQSDFTAVTKRLWTRPGHPAGRSGHRRGRRSGIGGRDSGTARRDRLVRRAPAAAVPGRRRGATAWRELASATGSGPRDVGMPSSMRAGHRAGLVHSRRPGSVPVVHAVSGRDATTGLEAGMIALALIMAMPTCTLGLRRRLAEYQ